MIDETVFLTWVSQLTPSYNFIPICPKISFERYTTLIALYCIDLVQFKHFSDLKDLLSKNKLLLP